MDALQEVQAIYYGLGIFGIIGSAGWAVLWRTRAMHAKDKQDLQSQIDRANADIDHVTRELVAHRVDVAREYVSKDTLARLETQIVNAINRLGDRMNDLFDQNRRSPKS